MSTSGLKLPTRTEAEYRALRLCQHKACPWCGEHPQLARQVHNRFLVGCESDDCPADGVQCSGATVAEAWRKWDRRA